MYGVTKEGKKTQFLLIDLQQLESGPETLSAVCSRTSIGPKCSVFCWCSLKVFANRMTFFVSAVCRSTVYHIVQSISLARLVSIA